MGDTVQHELVIIGAGPGGYVAALRAAQLGLDVACIDREKLLGGTCLRVGCIPSKALLESSALYAEAKTGALGAHGIGFDGLGLDLKKMLARKDKEVKALAAGINGLFRKRKVTRYEGHARFVEPTRIALESRDGPREVVAKNVIIATGSRPATLPGVELDGDRIGTSTEALAYPEVPGHLVVIGAGAIGLELGSVWSRLGARVTVLEYLDRILPGMDAELAAEARKIFARQGLEFRLGVRVTGARKTKNGAVVELADDEPPVECDRVLLAVGRVPNTEGLGLDAIGLETDGRGFIPVDDAYRTGVPNVYAVGDVIPGPMLAHKASEEGIACVERMVTGYGHVNYDAIPNVVYTEPEVASVGRTEGQLQRAGIDYRKGSFPFMASGRARALGHTEGRVKVLADAESDRLLGVHIVGPRAGDLIAEAAVAIEFGASAEDLGRACHAHPTLPEALKEAALDVARRAIHI
ncbi:MAG: dihydrolipoyl dehydrogenase [Acidobacteria bacterium]|nr:MAG: dihydrolipoyl dehydrogenase [Acidobacteriota bacterium]